MWGNARRTRFGKSDTQRTNGAMEGKHSGNPDSPSVPKAKAGGGCREPQRLCLYEATLSQPGSPGIRIRKDTYGQRSTS